MKLDSRELAKWYPTPLVAFEGNHSVWMNHYASFLFGGVFNVTLAGLVGQDESGRLTAAIEGGGEWSAPAVMFPGTDTCAELVYVGEQPYIAIKKTSVDIHSSSGDAFSSVLANAGQLLIEPLAEMQLTLRLLDDELYKLCDALPDSAESLLNLTAEDRPSDIGPGGMSLPLALARLRKNCDRLVLLSRNQTGLPDKGAPDYERPGVYDLTDYMSALTAQVNSLLSPQGLHVCLRAQPCVLPCEMPTDYLRHAVMTLISLAARETDTLTLTVGRTGQTIKLTLPVSGRYLERLLDNKVCERSPDSADALHDYIGIMLVQRRLNLHGGKLFWEEGAQSRACVVTLPVADGPAGVFNAPADGPSYDLMFLSDVLFTEAFLPDWTRQKREYCKE